MRFLFSLLGIFFVVSPAWAAVDHIVINEIQIGGISSKDEYIKLYNPTDAAVDITGWRLAKKTSSGNQSNLLTTFPTNVIQPNSSFLITHPAEYTGSATADAVYSTSGSVASNNTVLLFSDAGSTVVDLVGFGSATSFESAAAVNPADGERLSRTNFIDTDNNAADFTVSVSSAPDPNDGDNGDAIPPNTSGGGQSSPAPSIPAWQFGDVLINEFVSDPTDDDVEWVELINMTSASIDISGWTLEDGGGSATTLQGTIASSPNSFYVEDKPKGNLNNTGDIIILKSLGGIVIDLVAYGDWDDGNINDNAPTADDPDSTARVVDGQSNGNAITDFTVTTTPTKGAANIITVAQEDGKSTASAKTSGRLHFSEIFPDPVGSDQKEFIELINDGGGTVDATNWWLEDSEEQRYVIRAEHLLSPLILPGEFITLKRPLTGIAMDNRGDTLRLFAPNKSRAVDTITFKDAPMGQSYSFDAPLWTWTTTPTPQTKNKITTLNRAPIPNWYVPERGEVNETLIFSAEDVSDPDNDSFTARWILGDGSIAEGEIVTYSYASPGNYEVSLTLTDERGAISNVKSTVSIGGLDAVGSTKIQPRVLGSTNNSAHVLLSELLPRPAKGEVEWIELFNTEAESISLFNWEMGDTSGSTFIFPNKAIIEPRGYLVLTKSETKLALNNDGDLVYLSNPVGLVVDEISYGSSPAGQSYALGSNGLWGWTSRPTPAMPNAISINNNAPISARTKTLSGNANITGTVTAAPGEIGKNIMYVGNIATEGIPKNIRVDLAPEISILIKRGDQLQISGTIKKTQGEPRLKVINTADLIIVGNMENETTPTPLNEADLEEDLGKIVTVSGFIAKGSSAGFTLERLNGETIRVVIPDSFPTKRPYPTGTEVMVVGILSRTKSGERVLVRNKEDLIVTAAPFSILSTPTLPKQPWYASYMATTMFGVMALLFLVLYQLWRKRNTPLPFRVIDEEDTV